MTFNLSYYPFKTATRNWYFLFVTGILSFVAGLYLLIIPLEICRILFPIFQLALITIGLSGIIFTAKDQKTIRSIVIYLCYIVTIFITIYYLPFHPNKTINYSTGLTSLYCHIIFLSLAFRLKRHKRLRINTINIIMSFTGIIFSLVLIAYPLSENLYIKIMLVLCYILYGISSFFISLGLKQINKFNTVYNLGTSKSNNPKNISENERP